MNDHAAASPVLIVEAGKDVPLKFHRQPSFDVCASACVDISSAAPKKMDRVSLTGSDMQEDHIE